MTSVERAVGAEDASNNGDVVGSVRDERGAVGGAEHLWSYQDDFQGLIYMPIAPLWKRLPIIRHIRALKMRIGMQMHYGAWFSLGFMGGPRTWEIAYLRAVSRGEA